MLHACLRRPFLATALAAVLCGLMMLAAGTALANVYATNLKIGGSDSGAINVAGGGSVVLSFILNENADNGVTLTIYRDSDDAVIRTVNLGALTQGANSWTWDGKNNSGSLVPAGTSCYFQVTASDDGHAAWEPISDDANPQNKYWLPTSVGVNNDPSSKYYGRIYVGEGQASGAGFTGAPKTTTNGFYLLNADCSDAVGQGNTARAAGVPWDYNTATQPYDTYTSPWHTCVAPDGRLICGGYYDGLSGCYALDPDCLVAQTILEPAPWTDPATMPSGLTDNHGNQTSVWVEGIGDDMKMFYFDEDYERVSLPNGNVYQFNIGADVWPIRSKPIRFISQWALQTQIMNDITQLRRDGEGNWFMSQYRWAGTDAPSVVKVSPDGKARLWESLGASKAFNGGTEDILKMAQSIGVDMNSGRIAVATRNAGKVHILGPDLDFTNLVTLTMPGTVNRDCTFDNVGNLYVVNSSAEVLRIYSPPDGANSSTTRSYGRIIATSGDVTPPSSPTVTDDGAAQVSLTQIHATWTAAADAQSGIARYECAVGTTPYDLGSYVKGWTSVGAVTQATITGLSLKSGHTYYVLVRAVNGAGLTGAPGISDGIVAIAGTSVGGAKSIGGGGLVAIENAVVTKKFTQGEQSFFYIEDQNRSAGIRCVGGFDPAEGHVVDVVATVHAGDEMYLELSSLTDKGPAAEEIKPVGMPCKSFGGGAEGNQRGATGGFGANTVGLYVKIWGLVEWRSLDNDGLLYFPINDGSVANSIWCYSDLVSLPEGSFGQATGVCSIKNGAPVLLMTAGE